MKPDLKRLREDLKDVYEKISHIERGDTVAVCWIDASTSEHVNVTKTIPNHNVETKRINERYIYLTVQRGAEFGDPHLILLRGSLDSEADSSIVSIPIYLVKRIEKLAGKMPEEVKKIPLTTHAKKSVTYSDGSVKHYD